MRKFLSLPQEKQNRIVTAAMTLFGEVGYKKAYISEIAAASGISKALVFHYFSSKKGLYSYLVYYTGKIVMTEAQEKRDAGDKDIFDRAITTIGFRLSLKSRYPAMNTFIESVYKEDDPEVAAEIKRLQAVAADMHAKVTLNPGEKSLFNSEVDPGCVVDIIDRYTEGVINAWDANSSIDKTVDDVTKCLNMLRKCLFLSA